MIQVWLLPLVCDPIGTNVIWQYSSISSRCLAKVRDKMSFQKEDDLVVDRRCFGGQGIASAHHIHPLVLTNKHHIQQAACTPTAHNPEDGFSTSARDFQVETSKVHLISLENHH